jgi:dTMP kinase
MEGLDGAGTTTQARKLHQYFTDTGVRSHLTREPTDGPVGVLIRDLLSGCVSPGDGVDACGPAERELALLFAADRLEHSRAIAAKGLEGARVVCDRYIFSSMAYQTLDPTISAEWVKDINDGCAVPDVTFFLDVSVDECLRRITQRNEKATVYENPATLEAIHDNYIRLAGYYEQHFGPLVRIDGSKSALAVHSSILKALRAHL